MTTSERVEPAVEETTIDSARLVFVGGLHRSGTTLLHDTLCRHPSVSGFSGTGAREDEGQHLQDVYPRANELGGSGRFGFHPQGHLTELDLAHPDEASARLLGQWAPHWDLERPVLAEKSPPNLIRSRYLQGLFPHAAFVMIERHPVEVALATRKWRRRTPLHRLLQHWFHCHDLMVEDAAAVDRLVIVRYEELMTDPVGALAPVWQLLGLAPPPIDVTSFDAARSLAYREEWERFDRRWQTRPYARYISKRFEADARRHGYSLASPDS